MAKAKELESLLGGLFIGTLATLVLLALLGRTPSHEWERLHEVTCTCDTVYVGKHEGRER